VNTLDLARTQFGITTLFHFSFVPSPEVAAARERERSARNRG
jgi:hypothetical protein